MAAASESVWAIDIGNCSLKALRLSTERGALEVVDFDNIRHGKILSGGGMTDAEKEELVAFSLRQFVTKHNLGADGVVVSVPSQNSFSRFVTLPPVEPKRIPEIVKFEAVQQIPFDISDVQWDWQRMSDDNSSELKVGIFAIKNDVVQAALEHFNREDIQVSHVQMASMALYNYILYDRPDLVNSDSAATVVLNVGAEITDLVVCTKSAVWQRCIVLGGNTFTKAIADTFHLNFEKAEKLKRTAPVSKYARQIFQAMRPVFTDLASEVQRSLGFYKSSNPNVRIGRIVAIGGGTKLRGLLKYLQQTLQMPVERPDSFKRVTIGSGVPAAKFGENICDFGVVYGLGLQGLGMAGIESNLLPRRMVRSMAWAGKGRWFLAAACILLAASAIVLGRALFDGISHTKNNPARMQIQKIINEDKQARQNLSDAEARIAGHEQAIAKEFGVFKHREVVPVLHEIILGALPNAKNNPSQAGLYAAFAGGDVEGVTKIDRKQRKQIFVTDMSVRFAEDVATAPLADIEVFVSSRERRRLGPVDEEGVPIRPGRLASGEAEQYTRLSAAEAIARAAQAPKPGFVVTISGYSPYESIEALIDPPNVGDQPSQWGLVTRLMHLADVNSPYVLYERTNPEHFKLQLGDVDTGSETAAEMPLGIGEESVRQSSTTVLGYSGGRSNIVLVDPMTKEIISKVPELRPTGEPLLARGKPVFQVNDHWFVLKMKFLWQGRPSAEMTN